jgi:hypothetical protein
VGDISNPGTNVANYGSNWDGQFGNVTTVGSAGALSQSYYGTSDQAGNVWEWNEALIWHEALMTWYRGLRGGPNSTYMSAAFRTGAYFPTYENDFVGFRVATAPSHRRWRWRRRELCAWRPCNCANGAEMLRLACCLATERGIEVCVPVHDAVLIEADTDAIDQAVSDCQAALLQSQIGEQQIKQRVVQT